MHGLLTTYEKVDGVVQAFDHETPKYVGRYALITGRYIQFYQNVADALNGKVKLAVKGAQSRDALRIIELARESHEKGVTVAWR